MDAGISITDTSEIYLGDKLKDYLEELGSCLKDSYLPFRILSANETTKPLKSIASSLKNPPIAMGKGGDLTCDYLGVERKRVDIKRPDEMISVNGRYVKTDSDEFLEKFFTEKSYNQIIEISSNGNMKRPVFIDDVTASGASATALSKKLAEFYDLPFDPLLLVPVIKMKPTVYKNEDMSLKCCDAIASVGIIPVREELNNEITVWETLRFLQKYSTNNEFLSKYFRDLETVKKIIYEMKKVSENFIPEEWRW